jgi:hypothetical protein
MFYTPSGGQTVSQAVQAAYAAGKRPALRSEWPSILGNTNGNSLSQALDYPIGAPGNGAAVLYDESNEEFVVANLLNQNEPVPIAAVALSPGLVVLDNAAVNCSGTSTPINILVMHNLCTHPMQFPLLYATFSAVCSSTT